jgi:hypothetical protein
MLLKVGSRQRTYSGKWQTLFAVLERVLTKESACFIGIKYATNGPQWESGCYCTTLQALKKSMENTQDKKVPTSVKHRYAFYVLLHRRE